MKTKAIITLLFSLAYLVGAGQYQSDSSVNVVALKEVIVSDKPQSKRLRHFKIQGHPSYRSFRKGDKYINLVSGYPKGKLSYIEFFFNTGMPNLLKKKLDIDYQDVDIQLLLFEVAAGNKIGRSLLPKEVILTVGKDHNGAFRIPLGYLNIRQEQLFIGFAVVSETSKTKANIYVRMNEIKGTVGYQWSSFFADWKPIYDNDIFKLKIAIED
ncbi:MAG: hypothetical protein JWP69_141 [Flaviaesturariibacter sp.]|nr:hypothetical protein [Flaviaesturariibacter sp.]